MSGECANKRARRSRLSDLVDQAAGLVSLLFVLAPGPAWPLEIGPEADLCAALNQVEPGQELLLLPGDYRAGCTVRRGGRPGAPLVIRAADPGRPPRLTLPRADLNLLDIRADDVTIRGLVFEPPFPDTDGVRIISGNRITVEECRFIRLTGIAVVANHASVRGLTVRRNVITDSNATAMYFGCHDGITCTVTRLRVEGNYIQGLMAPDPEIGYGIEVKLNSSAVIRGNIIANTKGPGIMVYGSRDLTTTSLVERNFVRGSRTSSGIVVGGGPAVIRKNISAWNAQAGIALENYGQRGLLRGLVIAHNTVYSNGQGGITVPEHGLVDAVVLNNGPHGTSRAPALPPIRPGLHLAGNVDCTWAPCFAHPEGVDFSPFPGSLLVNPGVLSGGDSIPVDDFFGARRSVPPTAGAVERPSGPVPIRP